MKNRRSCMALRLVSVAMVFAGLLMVTLRPAYAVEPVTLGTFLDKGFTLFQVGMGPQSQEEREVVGQLSGHALPLAWETQCGPSLDFQHVELYDGTLGVSVGFVDLKQRFVGQIQWENDLATRYANPGNVNGVRWCSGAMISNDLFLTAGHCFDNDDRDGWIMPRDANGNRLSSQTIATEMQVNFDFQVAEGGGMRNEVSFDITGLVEYRLGGVDFAIVRLAGNPGHQFGVAPIATGGIRSGQPIAIIGHPAGQPKQIEAGTIGSVSGDTINYSDVDTLGGNSGSPILEEETGAIVGVHTNGGCTQTGGANFGFNIRSITANSATIRSLQQDELAYLWASDPTASRYTAVDAYSYNSTGGVNTVTRTEVGRYTANFPGLNVLGGVALASSYGDSNTRCNVVGWGVNSVNVACNMPNGTLADSMFVVALSKNGASSGAEGRMAYLWSLTNAAGEASGWYSWNSTGGVNRVRKARTGSYEVTLPGINLDGALRQGGTVQVTKYGLGGGHCKVSNWFPVGDNMLVNVGCYDTAGNPQDDLFSLTFSEFYPLANRSWQSTGGFVWGDNTTAASYTPHAWYNQSYEVWNLFEATAARASAGSYTVQFPISQMNDSTVMTTGYGYNANYCKVGYWYSAGTRQTVAGIYCFDPAGNVVDSQYVAAILSDS